MAAVRLLPSVNRISTAMTRASYGEPILDRVILSLQELNNEKRNVQREENATSTPRLKDMFKMDGISYGYPGSSADVLMNANLEIRKGESIGIVGESGAGKTTAVDIIMGLLKPQEGCVLVDDQNINDDLEGWYRQIGYIPQMVFMLDDTFRMPSAFNTGTVILGAVSYSMQIYLDFSGYSDMAVGVSRMLGFDIGANFNLPYLAENVSVFWNRWHISLSTWLRDYVYIPLGGSRKGEVRTYLNLMVTMLVSGLWHGVGWTFMLWGLLHGVLSCLHRFADGRIHHTASRVGRLLRILATFVLVTLLWVIFRADDLKIAGKVFKAMFTVHSGINQPYTWTIFAILVVGVATYASYRRSRALWAKQESGSQTNESRSAENKISGFYPVLDLSKFWNLVLFFVFCGLTIIMGHFGNTAFIYGKF